jgi:GT2 family glycosyltransferase
MAAKSNNLPKYSIRAALVWIVPVISLLTGLAIWIPMLLSAALTPVEIPKLRQRLFGSRARKQLPCLKAPALMRLVVLWVIQAWWIVLWRAGMDAPDNSDDIATPEMLGSSPSANAPGQGLRGSMAAIASVARTPALAKAMPVDSSLAWSPKTLSVVLPCAGEGEFALRTVRAVFQSMPSEVLHEIIVVDDGTNPPLSDTHLSAAVQSQYRVKIIRHQSTVGLIGAKQDGGAAASGDIIVFFDCHVAPQSGWHSSFLRLVGENYRRIVVPMITDLNIDTWTQRGSGSGMAKCYLTWDADFKWFNSDDPYVPVLSGGLLGISRRWWQETQGYDPQMHGWGGENLDQSLRSWLCGGEIMTANDARVAHMWRVPNDPRTHPKYKVPPGAAAKNRMRAAVAWFGEYSQKLDQFPELRSRDKESDGSPWYGDVSNILSVRSGLQCKSYSWFMHRFKHVYEDGGLIPRETFRLRLGGAGPSAGKCLTYSGKAGTNPTGRGFATLQKCDATSDRQRWHGANRDNSKLNEPCCSGLRAWNTDQCLARVAGTRAETFVCAIDGKNSDQFWELTSDGAIKHKMESELTCASR